MTTSCKQVAQVVAFPTFLRTGLTWKLWKVATVATDGAEVCTSNYSADRGAERYETGGNKSSGESGDISPFPISLPCKKGYGKKGKTDRIATITTGSHQRALSDSALNDTTHLLTPGLSAPPPYRNPPGSTFLSLWWPDQRPPLIRPCPRSYR